MTVEELFIEEYKSLKKENKELKSEIEELRGALNRETSRKLGLYAFLGSLKLQVDKSDFSGRKYIAIGNTIIYEDDKFYGLISPFAKDETKKEEEK